MARIVRGTWGPPPFEVKIGETVYKLGCRHGYLGERHPTLKGWRWVTWLGDEPRYNGYFRDTDIIEIGTAFIE